jgi:subtilase family serine protease
VSWSRVVKVALPLLPPAFLLVGIVGPGDLAVRAAAAGPGTTPVGHAAPIPPGSRNLGPEATSTPLSLDVVLAPRNPSALSAFVQQVSDPTSPKYHDYLAKGQFGPRFGASLQTIAQVSSTLRSEGLQPGPVSEDDLLIPVHTTVAGAQSAFDTQIDGYQLPSGRHAHANTSPPHVPSTIAPFIVGVSGLSDVAQLQPQLVHSDPRALPRLVPAVTGPQPCASASGVSGSYTADQIAHAYGYDTGAYANGDLGSGETVALFELEPFSSTDIGTYQTCFGISSGNTMVNVTTTTVDGGAGSCPCTSPTGLEAELDIEAVSGLAPAASIDVYEAPNSNTGLIDEYAQIANDDVAQTISTSWGLCEQLQGSTIAQSEELVFEQMAAQGQSILSAAGDSGSEDCYGPRTTHDTFLAVDDPSSDPYVTGVGGTTLTSIGPPPTETAWNESARRGGAGGGGISTEWQMPSWQAPLGVISNSSGSPCGAPSGTYCREVPDVSASADPYDGFTIYYLGSWQPIGGTSDAAPMWGALVGLADEGCGDRAGFLNPALYARQSDLHDITTGNNDYTRTNGGLFPAGAGYDMATGLGTPATALFAPGVLCNSGVPSQLVVRTQPPASAAAGSNFTVGISVEDSSNNVVSADNTTSVSLAVTSGTGPSGAILSCVGGNSATVSGGAASFSCSINKVGTGYSLSASSSPSYTPATSAAFNVTPGAASNLAFVQGPNSAVAGVTITPAVTVAVEDSNGNVESGDNATQVSLAIGTNPGSGTLSGGSAVTVSSGIATFPGLSVNKVGTGYTLTAASAPSHTGATSAAFNVTVGSPNKLAFVQGPTSAVAGSTMAPAVTVAVEDANGNVETGDHATQVSLAFGTNPGGATLTGGSAVTVSGGVATFSGLSVNKVGTGYTLTATSSPTRTGSTSAAFNVTVGPPNRLVFVQGPTSTVAGSAITPSVTVAVEDANGNVESGDNATQVSLAIGTNPGSGTLSGGSADTVSSGIATFSGLSVNKVGTGYTLTATSSPSYTGATSAAFNVTPGAPSKLVFVQGPSSEVAGSTITPAVTVAVEDANGNVETGDHATQVSLAIGINPGVGTLSGGAAVTVSGGIATFSGLSVNKVGTGYTLTAASTPSYTGATSAAFNVTVGSPNKLVFVQGPTPVVAGATITPAVTVAIEDANANVETGDNATQVSLSIGNNPGGGTLTGGSAVTVSSGVATFSGLSIDNAGTGYTLTAASAPSYTGATSAAFRVTVGSPNKLAFVQGPSNTAAGSAITPAVTVAVEDANGNVETGDNATQVSVAIGTNPGAGTLSGGSSVTVSSGVATFSGLSIDNAGTGYTLTASSAPSYTGATSATFNITVSPSNKLAFVQGPTSAVAGGTITPSVTVAVEDANGNVQTGDNATQVALALGTNPGAGTLSGGSSVTVSSGVATFSGLSINKVGTGYMLTATSAPNSAPATSAAFNITPGAPNKLALIQGPSNTVAGSAITPSVTVAVEDANGNVETGDNATQVALAMGTNPGTGTLSGGSADTVSSGVATFSGLSVNKVGTGYTLNATSAPSYTPATSAAFNITVGSPSKLAFVQGPTSTVAGATITPAVTVAVEDANGNVETGDNVTQISLAIGTNPSGGTLTGGSAVTVSSGVATFSGLFIDNAGTGYTLTALSAPSYTGVTSAAFDITSGGGGGPTPPPPPPGAVSSNSCSSPPGTCVASNDGTTVTTSGAGALTVSQFGSNPTGSATFSSTGEFLDVEVAQGSTFSSVTIVDCTLNGGTILEWWNGSAWQSVAPETYAAGPPSCITLSLSGMSVPTIADLTGTVFAVAKPFLPPPPPPPPPPAPGVGYWMVGSDGGVFGFGDAGFVGSLPGIGVKVSDIVGMVPTADGKGYWMVGSDGGVFGFGDAGYVGSLPGLGIKVSDIVGIVPTADGKGYWMVGRDGGVFGFGDAGFVGSLPGIGVGVSDIVALVATADGKGYWMVGRDGGVFGFGDAGFVGSLPGIGVKVSDIVGMVPTADGNGYWMVGSDGGVFGFGDAGFVGSLPGIGVRVSNIVGIVPTADGNGYWMVGSDGGVFGFGDAGFVGSLPGLGVKVSNIVALIPTK